LAEEDELPPLIRIKDEEGDSPPLIRIEEQPWGIWGPRPRFGTEQEIPDPETFVGRIHPRWKLVEQGIEERHHARHQAFRNRRRQVNQGTYVESLKASPITEQMEWESVEKGSPLWEKRRATHWKLEIERMFIPWPVKADVNLERMDERREWMLGHLEIPFLRYPKREENSVQIMDLPENQGAVQEMVAKNPLFKGQKWWNLWLDELHPERVAERNLRLAEDRRALELRWQQAAQQRARVVKLRL
jgi:hypothetical protein